MTETKFDAKTAERGSKWRMRDGRTVTFITYVPEANIAADRAVCVTAFGSVTFRREDGRMISGEDDCLDIIGPAPEPVILPECWVVRWVDEDGAPKRASFGTEQEAKNVAEWASGHITHILAQEVVK